MKRTVLVFCFLLIAAPAAFAKSLIQENAAADIKFLTALELGGRKAGTEGEERAAEYLKSRFQEMGFSATVVPFSGFKAYDCSLVGNGVSRNVIARWPAADENSKTIIIGAHFDGVGYPAANDNASGVAALLALAKITADSKRYPWNHNLIFAAFGAEETGLCGSLNLEKSVSSDSIRYMINLDMVGGSVKSPEGVNIVYVLGDDENEYLKNAFSNSHGIFNFKIILGREINLPFEWHSDHQRFHNAGVPSLFLTGGNTTDHHSVTDTEEKIEYDYLESVIYYTYTSLRNLDKK